MKLKRRLSHLKHLPQQLPKRRHHLTSLLLALLLGLPLLLAQPVAAQEKAIRIAITPCTDIIKTFKIFQPLARYLEGKINRPVELVIPKDFYHFESLVKDNAVHFAYQAPHTYVRMAHLYNQETLLKSLTPEGEGKHRGVVIVRKDSPITSLKDLKGRVVMFGSELSTAKCIAPKLLLKENAIDIDKDLKRYIHNGSCESIALSIYLKSVDAGAICDYSFEEIDNPEDGDDTGIPAHQLRIIADTMEIPTWVFSALKSTDSDVVTRVFHNLRALDREQEEQEHILEAAEIGGFAPAKDSDYEQIRQLAKESQ